MTTHFSSRYGGRPPPLIDVMRSEILPDSGDLIVQSSPSRPAARSLVLSVLRHHLHGHPVQLADARSSGVIVVVCCLPGGPYSGLGSIDVIGDCIGNSVKTLAIVDDEIMLLNALQSFAAQRLGGIALLDEVESYLEDVIRSVSRGLRCLTPGVTNAIGRAMSLSSRQVAILELLAAGRQVKHLGRPLGVSAATVKRDLRHVYQVYGVANRSELCIGLGCVPVF